MLSIAHTLRHAVRRLSRARAFSVAAVLTLALGIGATTAVFSVVNGILLRPLPFDRPEQLVDLSHTLTVSGVSSVDQSDASYLHYRESNTAFSEVGGYRSAAVNVGRVTESGVADGVEVERVAAGRVSASLLSLLGVAPLRGRHFSDTEDRPAASPVVLIGEGLWKRKYAADAALVGRHIEIDGVAREVIGIMPDRFRFPEPESDLWIPLALDRARYETATFDVKSIARLREGVSISMAAADVQRLLLELPEVFPGRLTLPAIEATNMRAAVRPLRDVVVGDIGRVLWIVLGSVGIVLLVACANVTNLFLIRAEGRQRELAVRRALGAGRGAIVGEFVAEGVVLAIVGGTLGVALAAAAVRLLRTIAPSAAVPRLGDIHVDLVVLAVAALATIFSALLVSAFPAIRSGRTSLAAVLTGGGRSATAGKERHRVRNGLVVAQVALALVLLAGSGLMARSFARLRSVDPGFDPTGVLTLRIALPSASYPTTDAAAHFFTRTIESVTALPRISAAGVASRLPLDQEGRRDSALWVEDRQSANGMAGEIPAVHEIWYVSPGYFGTMRIALVAGRLFEPVDPVRPAREVIVSRALATRYWGAENAIGKRVRANRNDEWSTIVGVVGNVHATALEQVPDEIVYLPIVSAALNARWTPRDMAVVVRTDGDPSLLVASVGGALRGLDPGIPVYRVRAMRELVSQAAARTSFTLLLLGIAATIALVLGAIGLYGVLAYAVSLRIREIGVRLALGAHPADVRRMITRQAVAVTVVGVATGLAGALVLTRVLASLLYQVSPHDPLTLGAAATLLLAVALVASWLPARRAAAVDPVRALRAD